MASTGDGRLLSKSRYVIGLQCSKRLWWTVHEPDAPELAEAVDAAAARREVGVRVGAAARERVAGGVEIVDPGRGAGGRERRAEETRRALAAGARVLFEASFIADGAFAAVDVLEKAKAGYRLAEVKASLDPKPPRSAKPGRRAKRASGARASRGLKPEHQTDLAFQVSVAERAGVALARAELMLLNRACRAPALETLFVRRAVTKKVRALAAAVPARVTPMGRGIRGRGSRGRSWRRARGRGRCWRGARGSSGGVSRGLYSRFPRSRTSCGAWGGRS